MNWETEQVTHLVSGNFGQEDYDYWNYAASEALEAAYAENVQGSDRSRAIKRLAQRLEDELYEGLPETEGIYGSWLKGAISEVDFREVAELAIEGAE